MPIFHTKSTAKGSLTSNQRGLYNQRLFKFKAFRFNHSLPLCWGLEPNHMSVTCQSYDKIAPFLSTESRLQSILWSMLAAYCSLNVQWISWQTKCGFNFLLLVVCRIYSLKIGFECFLYSQMIRTDLRLYAHSK